jgi:hypothetical protein
MNDWRSTFDGANDHEADWEQCFVVGEEGPDGSFVPAWFCAAAHDEKGDDLRRRWDDPRLQILDGHPVVYPGAGSHATYLERGEYIMRLPIPGEEKLHGPLDLVRTLWHDRLGQPDPGDLAERARSALSVPFVDYARGDGISVGPGGDIGWTPVLIDDATDWVTQYRGLWGLDTGDRFAGERAPAGPRYTRTGTLRQSWYDPVGFAGLEKVAPPSQAVAVLDRRLNDLAAERAVTIERADAIAARLPLLDADRAAVRSTAGANAYRDRLDAEIVASEAELALLRAHASELDTVIVAGNQRRAALQAGHRDDPRVHLRHAAEPEPPAVTERRALAEGWAALSVGLLIAALAVVIWFRILPPWSAIVVLLGAYVTIESFFRKDMRLLVLRISLVLAAISAVILVVTFLREVVLVGLLAIGVLLIVDNIGELRRRSD